MIKFSNVSKSYEGKKILSSVTTVINNGDKVGLVGQNGVGKSTLLRIAAQLEKPDEGSVLIDKSDNIGYLPQSVDFEDQMTVREFLLRPFASILENQRKLDELNEKLTKEMSAEELEKVLAEYGEIQTKFEAADGYNFDKDFETILEGLGLKVDMENEMSTLSGGQKARIAIASMLLQKPTILLLDEPTNHLDMPALIWLESYLSKEGLTQVVVSHDRRFLDRVVNRIIEIDPNTHRTIEFGGNYTDYVAEKVRLFEKSIQDYDQQQKRFKAIEKDIARTKRQAQYTESATKDSTIRRYAKKVAKKAKSRENRLNREITSEEAIIKPEERQFPKIAIKCSLTKETLVSLKHVSKSYSEKKILKDIGLAIRGGEKIAIVGENGTGKTTLLRIINQEIMADKGNIYFNPSASIGYLPQEYNNIPQDKKVLEWFRGEAPMPEDEARSFLGSMAFTQESLFRKLSTLSFGEISRLLVSILVAGDYNLLLLDEPTNHLDFESVELVESALDEYEGAVIAITHDRYFIEEVEFDRILLLRDGSLKEYSSWQEYESEVILASRKG